MLDSVSGTQYLLAIFCGAVLEKDALGDSALQPLPYCSIDLSVSVGDQFLALRIDTGSRESRN